MTCESKEHEIKTKIVQKSLQLKIMFLSGYNLKSFIQCGREGLNFGTKRIKT